MLNMNGLDNIIQPILYIGKFVFIEILEIKYKLK